MVVESGTGSGSLTHSLARTVAPTGRVHTFDFHEKRVQTAKEEFGAHFGDTGVVVASHGDACADGFGPDLDGRADAVFLDLPRPWEAVGHARRALRRSGGGRMCSFSPCIEQVQRTAQAMRENGFKELQTVEVLLREFQVRRVTLPVYDPTREHPVPQGRKRKLEEAAETEDSQDPDPVAKEKDPECTMLTGLPLLQMPGHTGYLTFATASKQEDTEGGAEIHAVSG